MGKKVLENSFGRMEGKGPYAEIPQEVFLNRDYSGILSDVRGIQHRLFNTTIEVNLQERDDDRTYFSFKGVFSSSLGGRDGIVSLAQLETTFSVTGEVSGAKIAAVLGVEGVNQDIDGFFEACKWYVDVQREIEKFHTPGATSDNHSEVIGDIGFLGYAKVFSIAANDAADKPDPMFKMSSSHAYMLQVEQMRLSGISPAGYIRSLLTVMCGMTQNLKLLSVAIGIPVDKLKEFAPAVD